MKLPGIWTFCLHPNVMTDELFEYTEAYIKKYQKEFVAFRDLDLYNLSNKNLASKILSWLYFSSRKVRGIK